MLSIVEHASASYGPRTYHNAHVADLTAAFAVDFRTAGERLTHKAAGGAERYVALSLQDLWIDNARTLYAALQRKSATVLNVAGNGIYTLNKHDFNQEMCNEYVYHVIRKVHEHHPITKIVSGGQTGVDLAGGVVGYKLGIDAVMTLPMGFRQRHEDGVDVDHTEEEIRVQVLYWANKLSA
jgi:hypothetical protein